MRADFRQPPTKGIRPFCATNLPGKGPDLVEVFSAKAIQGSKPVSEPPAAAKPVESQPDAYREVWDGFAAKPKEMHGKVKGWIAEIKGGKNLLENLKRLTAALSFGALEVGTEEFQAKYENECRKVFYEIYEHKANLAAAVNPTSGNKKPIIFKDFLADPGDFIEEKNADLATTRRKRESAEAAELRNLFHALALKLDRGLPIEE